MIDGHLDLAMNGLLGRDLRLSLEDLRLSDPASGQIATISFPELKAAGLKICFATLFAMPYTSRSTYGYTSHAGAEKEALAQLEQYLRWQDEGLVRILLNSKDVQEHLNASTDALGVVLLMEGADPIKNPDELPLWHKRGVRIIGPAWQNTRYAGGTLNPGPLTDAGKELVSGMKEMGIALDASHLDEEAFWDAVAIAPKLIASHSNSQRFASGNRHLSDAVAKATAQTGGVIGLVFLGKFIRDGWDVGMPKVELQELLNHAMHYASIIGWDKIGIGSDLDGGFGAEKTPAGIERYSDLPKFIDLVPAEYRDGIKFGNWQRWLIQHLG